jgi:tetratricopeptide (TPR) repeat protein
MVSNFDKLELGKLKEREGLELLKGTEIFDKEEAKALENLVARFDYLTLALDMSSRLLAQGRYSPASLNSRLNKKGLALFEGLQDPVFHKSPDLVPLFQASFDMLAKDLESTCSDKETAKVLVSVGGWFAPTPIRKKLLASGVSRLPRLDESAVTVSMTCPIPEKRSKNRYPKDICIDGFCAGACFPKDKVVKEVKPDQVERAIGLLNFYSLMTRGNHGKVIIHKLVQAFGRRQAPLVGGVAMVGALMDVGQLDLDWEHFVYAFELVLSEGGAQRAGIRLKKEDEVRFIQRIGVPVLKLYVKGFQPSTALSLASRCRRALVELGEPLGGATWVRLLSVEARAHDALGNYSTSEGLWRQVIDQESACAQDCRDLGYALEGLAHLLYIQGKCKEAESLYRRTLDVWQNVSDVSPLELSIIIGNSAQALACLGKYSEAEVLHRQSYKTSAEIRGFMHPETAVALNDLGNVAGDQGNYDEAETHFRNCLSIAEGTQKPSYLLVVALCGHNLAFVLATLGKNIEAESLLQRAWDIREKLFGPDHPETTAVFTTMGYVYQSQGRYSEAEALFRRGLETWRKVHGLHVHPYLARNFDRLGSVLEYQGKYIEAGVAYEMSICMFTEVFGPYHLETSIVLNNLGGLLERQGHFVEAEILFRRSLEIVQKTLGLHHLTTAKGWDISC